MSLYTLSELCVFTVQPCLYALSEFFVFTVQSCLYALSEFCVHCTAMSLYALSEFCVLCLHRPSDCCSRYLLYIFHFSIFCCLLFVVVVVIRIRWCTFFVLFFCLLQNFFRSTFNQRHFAKMCGGCVKWRYKCHLGASFFEDVPVVEFMYLVFTRMPGGVTIGDSGL